VFNGYCRKCWPRPGSLVRLKGRVRCVANNCQNYTDQGVFCGDLCAPCHAFVAVGMPGDSQAQRNATHFVVHRIGTVISAFLEAHLGEMGRHQPAMADRELAELIRKG
jgi:hypothetical protein